MSGLPTVAVKLDDGSNSFPYDVTSFVRLVDNITIQRGRADEFTDAQASTLALTLDNLDGRFSLGSTIIASPSPIFVDNKIRVTNTFGPAATNMVSNPSIEVDTTGYAGTNATVARSTAWSADRSASLQITSTGVSSDSFTSIEGDTGALRLGMQAGRTYTASATVNTPTALTGTLAGVSRSILVYTRVGTGPYVAVQSAAGPVTGSARVSITFTVPAGATEAFIRLYNGSPTLNETVQWDAILVEESNSPSGYFDGATAADATYTYAWTGAANASTSTRTPVPYPRFTGYVQNWPVAWPDGGDTFAVAQVQAVDGLARLDRRELLSVIEEQAAADGPPLSYYTLADKAGATYAANSSPYPATWLTPFGSGAAISFGAGTGPDTDGLTAASFTATGQSLKAATLPILAAGAQTGETVEFYMSATAVAASGPFRLVTGSVAGIDIDSTGHVRAALPGVAQQTAFSTSAYTDGATHHFAATYVASTGVLTLYVDGPSVATFTGATNLTTNMTGISLVNGGAVTGTLSHAANYPTAIDPLFITVHAQNRSKATLVPNATDWFFQRYARFGGFVSGVNMTVEAGLTNMASFNDVTGSTAGSLLLDCVTNEGDGSRFIDGSGNLLFYNRNHRRSQTTAKATLSTSTLDIGPDAAPIADPQLIKNYAKVDRTGGNSTSVGQNAASQSKHGKYPISQTLKVGTDAETQDRANWLAGSYAEPVSRFPTLTVDLLTQTTAFQQSMQALTLNDRIAVTGLPSQAPAGLGDLFVEGWTETIGLTTWDMVFNTSPAVTSNVWILENATYGIEDSTTRLGY